MGKFYAPNCDSCTVCLLPTGKIDSQLVVEGTDNVVQVGSNEV